MNTRLIAILLACFASSFAFAQADPCPSDINGDGVVAGADLSVVLSSWGPCAGCVADVNGDSLVDGIDLANVLSRWGGVCAPTVASMSGTEGPLAGGTSVTLAGDHLLAPTGVTFGGTPATIVSSTRSAVTVLAPARRAGAVPVVVTTQGGSATAGAFTYYGAPTITAVSPNTGAAVGGSVVSISGTGFFGSLSVAFGGVAAATVSVVSPTQLTVVAPAGTVGSTVAVSVSTASGSETSSGAFTYVAIVVPAWATLLEAVPDPAIVTNATLRDSITATGYAWRVRDNGTNIEMVLIPPGTFNMGCSLSNAYPSCNSDESPVHTVTLTNAFYIGRYEVTQAQWIARMGSNPSWFVARPDNGNTANTNRPVEQVSWNQIAGTGGFLSGTGLRLPTEAEWEYAYRAGTTTAFHGFTGYLNGTNDDTLVGNIAWFSGNNGASGTTTYGTKAVGQKLANGFGLHDMSGNVWEWVNDRHGSTYYSSSPSTNPPGPESGTLRVLRGGLWGTASAFARSSGRDDGAPFNTAYSIGFRVARAPL
jgi:formylglycine-generating enzyme required for sulfatase activity